MTVLRRLWAWLTEDIPSTNYCPLCPHSAAVPHRKRQP